MDLQQQRHYVTFVVCQAVCLIPVGILEPLIEWIEQNPALLQRRMRYTSPTTYAPTTFTLSNLSDSDCKHFMRFTKAEIRQILPYLRLDQVAWRNRYLPHPEMAFSYLLWRLSWPHRYKDLCRIFGRSVSYQSSIYNDVLIHLVKRFEGLMFWDSNRLTNQKIIHFCKVIEAKCGKPGIWGFVDGTIRAMCRPGTIKQRPWYTGYKKLHGFKFQAVTGPDGLVHSLAGPVSAALGDWALWHESGIEEKLRETFSGIPDYDIPLIYGDPAYTGAYGVIGAFTRQPGRQLLDEEQQFNTIMSSVRITIEQIFGRTIKLWASNSHKATLRIGHSPVAAPYFVAIFLTNIHTVLHGNQVSMYFGMQPPTLEEYLKSVIDEDE